MTFANSLVSESLDPDQERHFGPNQDRQKRKNVGPDLDSNHLRLIVFLTEFLKKLLLNHNKTHEFTSMQRSKRQWDFYITRAF